MHVVPLSNFLSLYFESPLHAEDLILFLYKHIFSLANSYLFLALIYIYIYIWPPVSQRIDYARPSLGFHLHHQLLLHPLAYLPLMNRQVKEKLMNRQVKENVPCSH